MPEQLDWLRLVGSFGLVLGLLLATLYLLRRWSQGHIVSGRPGRTLGIVESLYLGQRNRLLIIEADGQRLLIGVGPDGMRRLARLRGGNSETTRSDVDRENTVLD